MERRFYDENLKKMFDKINEIHNQQIEMNESQKRVELALFGDTEIKHIGLICQTQKNKEDLDDLKSFKKLLIGIASFISVILTLATNFIMNLLKGG